MKKPPSTGLVTVSADQTEVVELGLFSEQEAKLVTKDRLIAIQKLFEPAYDPYSGINTLPERCQIKNLPNPSSEANNDHISSLLFVYASPHRVLGGCESEGELLKVQVVLLYCKATKKLFYIKHFYPASSPWKIDSVTTCEK